MHSEGALLQRNTAEPHNPIGPRYLVAICAPVDLQWCLYLEKKEKDKILPKVQVTITVATAGSMLGCGSDCQ